MLPARGSFSPMMVRISTDLPVPEPPTIPITSPRVHREIQIVMNHLLAELILEPAHSDNVLVPALVRGVPAHEG